MDVFEKKVKQKKEWWERSTDFYFRDKKRDPKKLTEDMGEFRKNFHQDLEKLRKDKKFINIQSTQKETSEYLKKFQQETEEYRKRMFGDQN